jgi:hypothetical protein
VYATQLNVVNTLVARNVTKQGDPDVHVVAGGLTDQGNNLVYIDSAGLFKLKSDRAGTAAKPYYPHIGKLQDNGGPTWTMALQPGSPAINAGTKVGVTTDQRGMPRHATPDIGAYETLKFSAEIAPHGLGHFVIGGVGADRWNFLVALLGAYLPPVLKPLIAPVRVQSRACSGPARTLDHLGRVAPGLISPYTGLRDVAHRNSRPAPHGEDPAHRPGGSPELPGPGAA